MNGTKLLLIGCGVLVVMLCGLLWKLIHLHNANNRLEIVLKETQKQERAYRIMRSRFETAQLTDARQEQILWDAHLPSEPLYLFEDKEILLTELLNMEVIADLPVPFQIIGSFPSPGRVKLTSLDQIRVLPDSIILPDFGDYYLRTNVANFKLLCLDPELTFMQRVIEIASFLSANTVHSLADYRVFKPNLVSESKPQRLLPILFASDQPLKLHCGQISLFLKWVLETSGVQVRRVLLNTNDNQGHIAIEVLLPEEDRWIWLDPDFGVYVTNQHGKILGIEEIKSHLYSNKADQLKLEYLTKKTRLKPEYNEVIDVNSGWATPPFSWSLTCMTNDPYTTPEAYFDMLMLYTASIDYD